MKPSPQLRAFYGWRSAIVDSELEPSTRLVLLCLSLYMNERDTTAWPSLSRLTRDTGLDRKTVTRHLRAAIDAGFLTVSRGGPTRSNRYAATLPGGGTTPLPVGAPVPGGGGTSPRGVGASRPSNSPVNDQENSARDTRAGLFLPGSGVVGRSSADYPDYSEDGIGA